MSQSYWRDIAAEIIREVIENNPDKDEKELRKLISKQYPFGERRMHPYKIWLSEVKNQMLHRFRDKSFTGPLFEEEENAEQRTD